MSPARDENDYEAHEKRAIPGAGALVDPVHAKQKNQIDDKQEDQD